MKWRVCESCIRSCKLWQERAEIIRALNHIFDGVSMDCGVCDMKEICDEV